MNASDKILRDNGLLSLKQKIITGTLIATPVIAAVIVINPHNF